MARKARSLDAGPASLPAWQAVVFTDLHVSARTLDRALMVLARVRETVNRLRRPLLDPIVVCLGDFWDQRGVLSVRHVDALMNEFDRWDGDGIHAYFVPGNHDQVSQNGRVHGVRIFDAYNGFNVATEALVIEGGLAFVPWREDAAANKQMWDWVAGQSNLTIFGHAEVKGALANNGHKAVGRVTTATIETCARACYLGHYHARQKLGDRTWYIGSPFEMHMGERDQPHGIAIVDADTVEPAFIDLDEFPRHVRVEFGMPLPTVREQDIVEVTCAPDDIGRPELTRFIAKIQAAEVRPLPVKPAAEKPVAAFALRLEDALKTYVDIEWKEAEPSKEDVLRVGNGYLASVPEARVLAALSPRVEILDVSIENFCRIGGSLQFAMPSGLSLLRGPMGIGKTSVMDAMTWCLYGTTTPRKAGQHGASLRADEIIHDTADQASVAVRVGIGQATTPKLHTITIRRTKKRGQGAKLEIDGVTIPSGISDQQQVVNHVLGIDYDLWRTCVYLGQGAVGNFVTDADKRRKEMLAQAFGLSACAPAQKLVRDDMKASEFKRDKLRIDVLADQKALEVLRSTDYTKQIEMWDSQWRENLTAITKRGEEAKAKTVECDAQLVNEPTWLERKTTYEEHIAKLTAQLTKLEPAARIADLQRQIGGVNAEKGIIERDLAKARSEMSALVGGARMCPTCGKPFDQQTGDQHVNDLENRIDGYGRSLKTFTVKMANLSVELDNARNAGSAERDALGVQLKEAQAAHQKCIEALNQFAIIKTNRDEAGRRLLQARADYGTQEKTQNPFRAQQVEQESRVRAMEVKLATDQMALASVEKEQKVWQFWEDGFGQNGLAVLMLRTALYDLETYANRFLASILRGRVYCRLAMEADDLKILFFEYDGSTARERRYEQLSGGQRRCAELAFHPFALSELIFARCGVRVGLMVVDEVTTHLGQEEKPLVVGVLRDMDRTSVIAIDHDPAIQGEFDAVFDLTEDGKGVKIARLP